MNVLFKFLNSAYYCCWTDKNGDLYEKLLDQDQFQETKKYEEDDICNRRERSEQGDSLISNESATIDVDYVIKSYGDIIKQQKM